MADDAWREVVLLAVGYLAVIQQRDAAAEAAVLELAGGDNGAAPGLSLVVAADAAVEVLPNGVGQRCVEKLVGLLAPATTAEPALRPAIRAAAGRALAQLGDPRPEVTRTRSMTFCYVPAGPFRMGYDPDPSDVELAGYWIGRFPVTVAQFDEFVTAGGYAQREYWTPAGWQWRCDEAIQGPAEVAERFRHANAPVVVVTWHEAVAFAAWLTATAVGDATLAAGWSLRLPSEAQWEKAARGGLELPRSPVVRVLERCADPQPELASVANPEPERTYPWGSRDVDVPAACALNGIDGPTAVGCFPDGRSPLGVEDLAGNVWEWLQTAWGTDWWRPRYALPYDPADGREELAAGDDVLRMVRGGSYLVGGSGFRENRRHLANTYRTRNGPDVRHLTHGFRLCLVPPSDADGPAG